MGQNRALLYSHLLEATMKQHSPAPLLSLLVLTALLWLVDACALQKPLPIFRDNIDTPVVPFAIRAPTAVLTATVGTVSTTVTSEITGTPAVEIAAVPTQTIPVQTTL